MKISFVLLVAGLSSAVHAHPVAGLEPDRRPTDAPVMTTAGPPDANALHGVIGPVPEGVTRFMRDQGNWYTPFTRPGMTGPYDIRGWHANRPSPGKH